MQLLNRKVDEAGNDPLELERYANKRMKYMNEKDLAKRREMMEADLQKDKEFSQDKEVERPKNRMTPRLIVPKKKEKGKRKHWER